MNETESNLVQYVKHSLQDDEEFHFLRFEFLQRLNIAQIQLDLIRLKSDIHRNNLLSDENKQSLQSRLKDYSTAIRDYQELRNKRSVPKKDMRRRKMLLQRFFQSPDLAGDGKDPFYSHYAFFQDTDAHAAVEPLRQVLMRRLPSWFTYSHEEKSQRRKEYAEGQTPREVSTPVDRLARFLVALAGGSFLIVPMVIMSLNTSQTKSLVTVSVSVLLFVLVLSFVVRVSNVETLVATATYAAVLVVFVGTSNGSSGS